MIFGTSEDYTIITLVSQMFKGDFKANPKENGWREDLQPLVRMYVGQKSYPPLLLLRRVLALRDCRGAQK